MPTSWHPTNQNSETSWQPNEGSPILTPAKLVSPRKMLTKTNNFWHKVREMRTEEENLKRQQATQSEYVKPAKSRPEALRHIPTLFCMRGAGTHCFSLREEHASTESGKRTTANQTMEQGLAGGNKVSNQCIGLQVLKPTLCGCCKLVDYWCTDFAGTLQRTLSNTIKQQIQHRKQTTRDANVGVFSPLTTKQHQKSS